MFGVNVVDYWSIKNSLGRRIPGQKSGSRLTVALVFNTNNNPTRGHSSPGLILLLLQRRRENRGIPYETSLFFVFFQKN